MDINKANLLADARGFTDWTGESEDLSAALLNASDYIGATYRLRSTLTPDQQTVLDIATLLVARDILVNGVPAVRVTASVKKTDDQLGDLKTSVEYFAGDGDPYPLVTGLLAPLQRSTAPASYYSGIQVL